MKTMFKKNDTVFATKGRNRGKKGKVLAMYLDKGRILVEGLNFVQKCAKPSQKNPAGGFLKIEAPFSVSNVRLFCNRCQTPVRVGRRLLTDGSKERFCRKCQEVI